MNYSFVWLLSLIKFLHQISRTTFVTKCTKPNSQLTQELTLMITSKCVTVLQTNMSDATSLNHLPSPLTTPSTKLYHHTHAVSKVKVIIERQSVMCVLIVVSLLNCYCVFFLANIICWFILLYFLWCLENRCLKRNYDKRYLFLKR